jgi:hypothetical protein
MKRVARLSAKEFLAKTYGIDYEFYQVAHIIKVKQEGNFTYTDNFSFLRVSFITDLNVLPEHPPIRRVLGKRLPGV